MSLSDLLGLLFLLFFVILPALQGLRRAPPTPPVFPEEPFPEPRPAPKPKPKAKPRPKPSPALEPRRVEGESLERLLPPERTPLEVRFREEVEETPTPKKRAKGLVSTDPESLLKGVIWHEILKKPKGW
jgi:outer membrane biosynthesis protein TonB